MESELSKWIHHTEYHSDYYECPICKETFCLMEGTPYTNSYNYCPNCGAKMDNDMDNGVN